jgi:hypothetical protein
MFVGHADLTTALLASAAAVDCAGHEFAAIEISQSLVDLTRANYFNARPVQRKLEHCGIVGSRPSSLKRGLTEQRSVLLRALNEHSEDAAGCDAKSL